METVSFDALTRRAAGRVSRRGSLLTLGAMGLATLVNPFTADAKNKNKNKKQGGKKDKKNKQQTPPVDLCAAQVGPCTATLTAQCRGEPFCQDSIACCSHLGTCDSSQFFACLVLSSQA